MSNEQEKIESTVETPKVEAPQIDPKLQQQLNQYSQQILDLQKQLDSEKASKQKQSETEKLEAIKADSDIRKLLLGDEPKKRPENIDDLRPSEVLDLVSEAFEKSFEAKKTQASVEIEERLSGVSKSIEDMKLVILQQMAEKSVSQARSQFKDFDEHKAEIGQIIETIPNINIKDAYLLAKARKVSTTPEIKEVISERPDNFSTNQPRALKAPKREPDAEHDGTARSRTQFRNILNSAVDRVLANRSGND